MIWDGVKRKRRIKERTMNLAKHDDDPSYEERLTATESEIHETVNKFTALYDKAEKEFKEKTSLTSRDITIMLVAAGLQIARWIILSNGNYRFKRASDPDKLIEKATTGIASYVPATFEQIILSLRNSVPYDAITRSPRFKNIYFDETTGLAGTTHRVRALGHDPLAGLIIGTANITTNTLTVNNIYEGFPSYHILNNQINAKTDLGHIMKWTINETQTHPKVVGAAFIRQIVHLSTDLGTKQGLPIPVINNISPEFSQFLINNNIDFYSVSRGMLFAVLINKFIEMLHRFFADKTRINDFEYVRLYDVRTKKIIMYSNTLSSILNLSFTAITNNYKKLDVGGLLVTLWNLINNKKEIAKIKEEFIRKTLDGELKKEEELINERLAPYGYAIDGVSINKFF